MYFGLLSILTQVGVAESEKRVAAIFLPPVWALEPAKRSFLPYSGSYGCLMAGSRPEMLLGKFFLFRTVEGFKMKKLDTQIFEIPFLG